MGVPSTSWNLVQTATGWPAAAHIAARPGTGMIVTVPGGAQRAAVAAPVAVPEGADVTIEADVRLPAAPGAAGVFCRGTQDHFGYALVADAAGRWSVLRGDGTPVGDGRVDPPPAEGAASVRLTCGWPRGGTVRLRGVVGGGAPLLVEDRSPSAPPSQRRVGLAVVREGTVEIPATFERFAVGPAGA